MYVTLVAVHYAQFETQETKQGRTPPSSPFDGELLQATSPALPHHRSMREIGHLSGRDTCAILTLRPRPQSHACTGALNAEESNSSYWGGRHQVRHSSSVTVRHFCDSAKSCWFLPSLDRAFTALVTLRFMVTPTALTSAEENVVLLSAQSARQATVAGHVRGCVCLCTSTL
jgi:hypothetical protein